MMCFLPPVAVTLKSPDWVIIDIEISNSGLACLEISKSPSVATAAGGLKNLIIDGPPCSSTTNSLVTMVKSNKSFPFVKKKRL